MNKSNIKRMSIWAIVLVMIMSLLPMSVSAAGYGVSAVTLLGSNIQAGQSFAIKVDLTGPDGPSGDIVVTGLGSLSGSNTLAPLNANFSGGAASVIVAPGVLHYNGEGTASIMISVGGDTFVQTVSGFAQTVDPEEMEPSTPTMPKGAFYVDPEMALPVLSGGKSEKIIVPIKNSTTRHFANVKFDVSLPDGIYFNTATNIRELTLTMLSTKELELDVTVSDSIESGIYRVNMTAYADYYGTVYEEELSFNVRVEGTGSFGSGRLSLIGYQVSPETVQAGDQFTLTLSVHNNSADSLTDIPIQLTGFSTNGFTIDSGVDIRSISKIKAGGLQPIKFDLIASNAMSSGNHILDVIIGDGASAFTTKIFIPVRGKGASADGVATSKPQIVMENYDYGEASAVIGGSNFLLKMQMRNTSKQVAIENIKMTVTSVADETAGGVFTPANSSNSFFIERVGAGEIFEREIELTPKADAAPKSYGLRVSYTYEAVVDGERVTLDSEETLNIPVVQPDRFEVGEIESWGPFYVGQPGYVYIQYVNKGKTPIYNLSIETEGNFTVMDLASYIGNVDSGSADGIELSIVPNEPGTLSGTIKFIYEDSAGNEKQVSRELTGDAMEMFYDEPIYEDPGMMDMPVDGEMSQGLPIWAWIAIIGGSVVIIGVVTLIVVKKIKKKKALKLEEEDDYDE